MPLIHRFCLKRPTGVAAFPCHPAAGHQPFALLWRLPGAQQVPFARVITDKATFGYLADVFVLPEHRGQGYSKALVAAMLDHPELQGLRRLPRHLTPTVSTPVSASCRPPAPAV